MAFDYAMAWQEVARPAFESLPANIRALVERVSTECKELHQLSDCSMPWPEDSDLRQTFDKIPAEWLAQASHVVYFVGHWFPGGKTPRLVPNDGCTWKFAHYADQSLRARLGLPDRGDNGRDKSAIQYQVHEGLIRLCYQSPDMWTWREIAPATAEGLETAKAIAEQLRAAINGKTNTRRERDRDDAAYTFMETLDKSTLRTFAYWQPWADTNQYQCTEDELKRREAARRPPVDREAMIATIEAERDATIKKTTESETIKAAGKIWLIHRGLPIDNAIYYSHTKRWAFGWYRPLSAEDKSLLLDHLSEFPYDYDFSEPRR